LSNGRIRVQYSGFIVFAAQMLSVVTGLIFTLLLTRNMTTAEYGIWSNIFDLMGYFTIVSGLFPFWVTRFVARGREAAIKTGLLANLILALVAVVAYFPLVSLVISASYLSGAYVFAYLVAFMQIINAYMISMLESCLRAVKPQAIGYGLLIEEVCKVTLAYVLVIGTHQLFLGAMMGIIVGASVQAAYYFRLATKHLVQRIQWNYLREWIKGSTAILYNAVGNQLAAFVVILLFYCGGQAVRGEYQAALTFANIVGYSSFLAFALYPKLLAKNSSEDVASSFRTVLMFAIPLAAIVLAMAQSLLMVLNVSYSTVTPVLILLTIDALWGLVSTFYSSLLLGVERLDEEAKIPLNKLVRSNIFKAFTLPYVQAALALPATYYVLTRLTVGQPMQALLWVTTINMLVHGSTFLGLYASTRKSVRMPVPLRSIGKYVFASAVPAIVLYLTPHPTTLLLTAGIAIGGMVAYATLLSAIDRDARELIGRIWRELGGVFSSLHSRG
jgi:O-antigen/teichoic acid export membrane protein